MRVYLSIEMILMALFAEGYEKIKLGNLTKNK